MIKKHLRLIIAAILLLGGIGLIIYGLVSTGVLLILTSGLFVLTHFKNEMNLAAFYFVKKGKFQSAEKVLSRVKNPENMIEGQEAYHYFLWGLIESQKNNISKADKRFKKALSTGLRMEADQAMAKLNLSGIALSQRNKKLARYYLQETKKLDKQKLLSSQIKEIEAMMKRI